MLFVSYPESLLLIKNLIKKVAETICKITKILFKARTLADIRQSVDILFFTYKTIPKIFHFKNSFPF